MKAPLIKKVLFFAGLLGAICFLFTPILVNGQVPFGGMVTFMFPACQMPPGTWVILGPPTPMSLFVFPGQYTFSYGPPYHPGQNVLGMTVVSWVPCIIWVPCGFVPCPIVIGGGMMMLYNGSSI